MSTLRALFIFIAVIFLAGGFTAFAEGIDTGSRSFTGMYETTDQTAVFVTFAAHVIAEAGVAGHGEVSATPEVSTSLSVSNPLAMDPMSPFLSLSGYVTEGTIEVYLWDQAAGDLISYETSDDSVGTGLAADGTLPPGGTWTFLLSDLLNAAGWEDNFVGYGWIVANFDGVAGTHTTTVFNVGFNQSFHATPAVGQGFHGMAGLPVEVPSALSNRSFRFFGGA